MQVFSHMKHLYIFWNAFQHVTTLHPRTFNIFFADAKIIAFNFSDNPTKPIMHSHNTHK